MRLFEINKEIEKLEAELLLCEDGTEEKCLNYEVASLWADREKKIKNVTILYKMLSAEAEMIKAEGKKIADRGKVLENKAESLKHYLAMNIEAGEKVSDPLFALSWRRSKSVLVTDETLIPEHLFRIKKEVAKDKVKELLTSGCEVPGAELEEKNNLVIK